MINQQAIQTLRRETKAGIMDCKNALMQTGGSVEAAMELLLERGFQIAEKKAERVAADGVAYACVMDETAILLEVNTETDFVSANREFLADVHRIAEAIARHRPADIENLLQCPVPGTGETVETLLQRMTLAFREKIVLRRFAVLQGGLPVAYTHLNGQYGVILTLSTGGAAPRDKLEQIGKELALQIAASAPQYVSREAISAEEREGIEAAIAQEMQADAQISGKPAHIREKILAGRIEKFYRTGCLLEQAFIKNPEQTVGEHLQAAVQGWESPISVDRFYRYQKAEGLQSEEEQSNLQYVRQITNPAS